MNIIEKIKQKGELLYETRQEINALEEAHKAQVDVLKAQRDKLQENLIDALNKNELSSIKVKSGDSFIVAKRKSVVITDEFFALNWAKETGCVSINKTLVGQELKETPKNKWPKGLEMEEKQFISVRKAKAKKETLADNMDKLMPKKR